MISATSDACPCCVLDRQFWFKKFGHTIVFKTTTDAYAYAKKRGGGMNIKCTLLCLDAPDRPVGGGGFRSIGTHTGNETNLQFAEVPKNQSSGWREHEANEQQRRQLMKMEELYERQVTQLEAEQSKVDEGRQNLKDKQALVTKLDTQVNDLRNKLKHKRQSSGTNSPHKSKRRKH